MPRLADEQIEALNILLEDERASVEIAVALSSGATVHADRLALSTMGSEDVEVCSTLHESLERMEAPVTRQINGIVLQVLGMERYDDRLRGYARHLLDSGLAAQRLVDTDERHELDADLRDILRSVTERHVRHALWTEQRAEDFAATRTLRFRASLSPLDERERLLQQAEAEEAAAASASSESDRVASDSDSDGLPRNGTAENLASGEPFDLPGWLSVSPAPDGMAPDVESATTGESAAAGSDSTETPRSERPRRRTSRSGESSRPSASTPQDDSEIPPGSESPEE